MHIWNSHSVGLSLLAVAYLQKLHNPAASFAQRCPISGMIKVVELLLSRGSSVHERDMAEQSPLHHACDWDHLDIASSLLKKGADVNATDNHGFTPFLVAAGWGREATLELLLTKNVDVTKTDDQGNNVFHICAACGRVNVMKIIINMFLEKSLLLLLSRNTSGWTPLDFSVRCGHFKATRVLIKTILKNHGLQKDGKSFIHTRFNIIDKSDLDFSEKYLYRFVDPDSDLPMFRIPRCKWYIQSPGKEEYELVRQYVHKFDERLRAVNAKT